MINANEFLDAVRSYNIGISSGVPGSLLMPLTNCIMQVDNMQYVNNDRRKIKLEIHVGKNRIVRRMFSFMGYNILKLDRVGYKSLTQKNLSLGEWRFLGEREP